MKLGDKIVLDGVTEYCEKGNVELIHYDDDTLCVVAYNEGGYNNVAIDFENNTGENK